MARPKRTTGRLKLKRCRACHEQFAELFTASKCRRCASDPENYSRGRRAHPRDACLDQYFEAVEAGVNWDDTYRALRRARVAHELGEAGLEAFRNMGGIPV